MSSVLHGLTDEPRPGAPRRITDTQVEDVVVRTLESTPPGATHWSTRGMAKVTGLSHATISRIWRTFGLQPHRTETFKPSPDPFLIDKVRDVVGLYVDPPEHAVVFCVDEKPQIQALERTGCRCCRCSRAASQESSSAWSSCVDSTSGCSCPGDLVSIVSEEDLRRAGISKAAKPAGQRLKPEPLLIR